MSDLKAKAEEFAKNAGERVGAALANRPKPVSVYIRDMAPREHPKGAKIHKQPTAEDDQCIVSVQAHVQYLWALPIVLSPFFIFFSVGLGAYFGIMQGERQAIGFDGRAIFDYGGRPVMNTTQYFSIIPTVFLMLLSVGVLVGLWIAWNPRLKFTITKTHVTIGKYRFERKYSSGLRIGYQVDATGEVPKSFTFNQILFSGLRLSYGPWGEDLPYMVNKYHSAEYVLWINQQIAAVGAPEPKAHAPEHGERAQSF